MPERASQCQAARNCVLPVLLRPRVGARPCRLAHASDRCAPANPAAQASKAALNQLTKTMSLEFERKRQPVACVLLHPGTVDTDLSKPFQKVG